jgi:UDP-N-acetylmuramate dehydrogenase
LAKITWFQVGGVAEILFRPADTDDLSYFLKNKPKDIPVTILGVGSNILVRDGGIDGVVIRMGRNFARMQADEDKITVGAGCLDVNVAKFALENSIGGLEFLVGVPGTIGGALAMNAGAYEKETKDVLISAVAVDADGVIHQLTNEDMGFTYRHNSIPDDWIFTEAVFQGRQEDKEVISNRMNEISSKREDSQPIHSRPGGSTFKNPPGKKAWQLIDEAGCRGLQIGGAKVSEKHCNFLINIENATASDLENLGEEVRRRVKENSNIELEWEIKILGKKKE